MSGYNITLKTLGVMFAPVLVCNVVQHYTEEVLMTLAAHILFDLVLLPILV